MTYERGLAVGLVVYLAGTAVDQTWHATHSEFETAADQATAHWLIWLAVPVILVAAFRATRALANNRGATLALIGASAFAVAHVWHFWEHYQHRDPAAPHIVLVATQVFMVAGIIWTMRSARRAVA